MNDITYVGLDVHKATVCVAIAEDGVVRQPFKHKLPDTSDAARRRFAYRRLHLLLGREGLHLNHKKLRRLYREERLQVRHRGGRKRALGTRTPMTIPQGPNQRWSLDFVSDTLDNVQNLSHFRGRRLLLE